MQYWIGHRENKAYTLVTKETISVHTTAMKTSSWLSPNVYALFFSMIELRNFSMTERVL